MSNKKTILYLITQSELGGAQRYIFDLAVNLKNEFNIIVAFGEQGKSGELAKYLENQDIIYYNIPHLKRAISPVDDFLAFWEIVSLIKKIKPDIVHLNSSKISILGSLAAKIAKTPKIIYTVHGWVFNEPMSFKKKLFYKNTEKFTALFKDRLICVSEFDRQLALKEKITSEKKLITIHNGIQTPNFLPQKEARQKLFSTLKNFSISENDIIIGSIGNLYQTKGFEYLIEAIKLLGNKNIKTIIIGEGEERVKLQNLINQANLQNKIILAGRIKNAAELLKAFDIYVCSSVKEGLSYTIIEAMMANLPIIATKVGGNEELISEQKEGLLVEAKNPKQLSQAILRIINNLELKNSLSNNAKQKAETKFKLNEMIEKTKNIYS